MAAKTYSVFGDATWFGFSITQGTNFYGRTADNRAVHVQWDQYNGVFWFTFKKDQSSFKNVIIKPDDNNSVLLKFEYPKEN